MMNSELTTEWEKEIFYQGILDGKSLLEIEQFIQKRRLGFSFETWLGIWRGYTGVALPAIICNLYDTAQNLEQLKVLDAMMILDAQLSDLTKQSIKNLTQGLQKVARDIPMHEAFHKDNLSDALEGLKFYVEQNQENIDCTDFDLNFKLENFLGYISLQFGHILAKSVKRKSDNLALVKISYLLDSLQQMLIHQDVSTEFFSRFLVILMDNLNAALAYEEERIVQILATQKLLEERKNLKAQIDLLIHQYKNEITRQKQHQKQHQDNQKYIARLQRECGQYNTKYQKAIKAKDDAKAEKITVLIQQLKQNIENLKNPEEILIDIVQLQQLKHDATQAQMLLKQYEKVVTESQKFGLSHFNLELLGAEALNQCSFSEKWLKTIADLKLLQYFMQQQIDVLNGHFTEVDHSNFTYNLQRDEYLKNASFYLQHFKTDLSLYPFSHKSFKNYLAIYLKILPQPNPIDVKIAGLCKMLEDFIKSYYLMYQQQQQLDTIENIIQRFQATLTCCEEYLQLAKVRHEFKAIENFDHFSVECDVAHIQVDVLEPMLKQIDADVIDDELYAYLQQTLDQLDQENILSTEEVVRLKQQLNHEQLKHYEKIIDFDLDEFKNSVINSINSARRFKKLNQTLNKDYQHHLLTNFEHEIRAVSLELIPNQHEFYRYLQDEDKQQLIMLLKRMITLNNSFSGMNIKIASTLCSKQQHHFQLKQDIFAWSSKIADDYFYGLYAKDVRNSHECTMNFLRQAAEYLGEITLKLDNYHLLFDFINLVHYSLSWFVLNYSNYGGMALYKNAQPEVISERVKMLGDCSPQTALKTGLLMYPHYAKGFVDEYQTSLFLNHIDLRFKPFTAKYSSHQEYQQRILALAIDLREMRRLLVKNFKASDSILELDVSLTYSEKITLGAKSDKIYALWQWETFGDGLGRICIGYDQDDMHQQANKASRLDATYARVLRINWDGCLSAVETPWLDIKNMELVGVESATDLNLYLLEKFHELFFQRYLDMAQKVKRRVQRQLSVIDVDVFTEDYQDIAYDRYDYDMMQIQETLQKFDLNVEDEQQTLLSGRTKTYFNRSLKSKDFFKILQDKFDVVVSSGKGSEVNVSRVANGGRVQRLGHHGKVVEYNAGLIRGVLKRLNISLDEWVRECI
ncbi:hypothetical protein LVY74_17270 [Acinetobacter sp. ME22]|uniref:hypothetical protein n=1 Tax=Acinetobacter sp. ME22 TaxID=2904802 RepID=UPI001EDC43CC|nr:hypothetical protein [Acinetobacter sp. ME22]MCG2575287.1 hypothetical protein [Acinetobacter sp. ME22]